MADDGTGLRIRLVSCPHFLLLFFTLGASFGFGFCGKNRVGCASSGFRLLVLLWLFLFTVTFHLTFGQNHSPQNHARIRDVASSIRLFGKKAQYFGEYFISLAINLVFFSPATHIYATSICDIVERPSRGTGSPSASLTVRVRSFL